MKALHVIAKLLGLDNPPVDVRGSVLTVTLYFFLYKV